MDMDSLLLENQYRLAWNEYGAPDGETIGGNSLPGFHPFNPKMMATLYNSHHFGERPGFLPRN